MQSFFFSSLLSNLTHFSTPNYYWPYARLYLHHTRHVCQKQLIVHKLHFTPNQPPCVSHYTPQSTAGAAHTEDLNEQN